MTGYLATHGSIRILKAGIRDFEVDPVFEPLLDHVEFQAMMAEIEADLAAQFERVREMERNEELALARPPSAY